MSLFDEVQTFPEYSKFSPVQKREALSLALDEDLKLSPGYSKADPAKIETEKNLFLDDYFSKPDEDAGYNLVGGAGDVLTGLWDVATVYTPASVAALLEDENPRENIDWRDKLVERANDRTEELRLKRGSDEKVLPPIPYVAPEGVTRGDIRDATASGGFTAASMGAGLTGRAVGLTTPVPGGAMAGSMAGAGAAAYKMDKDSFSRELLNHLDLSLGRRASAEESQVYLDSLDEVIHNHALWEAGPEAIGTTIELKALSVLSKVPGMKGIFEKAVKGGAAFILNIGTELGTETVTQTGQQRAGVEAGVVPGAKREWNLEGLKTSLAEVGPTVLALTGTSSGVAVGYGAAKKVIAPQKETADGTQPPPSPVDVEKTIGNLESALYSDQVTPEEVMGDMASFVEAGIPAEKLNEILTAYTDDSLLGELEKNLNDTSLDDNSLMVGVPPHLKDRADSVLGRIAQERKGQNVDDILAAESIDELTDIALSTTDKVPFPKQEALKKKKDGPVPFFETPAAKARDERIRAERELAQYEPEPPASDVTPGVMGGALDEQQKASKEYLQQRFPKISPAEKASADKKTTDQKATEKKNAEMQKLMDETPASLMPGEKAKTIIRPGEEKFQAVTEREPATVLFSKKTGGNFKGEKSAEVAMTSRINTDKERDVETDNYDYSVVPAVDGEGYQIRREVKTDEALKPTPEKTEEIHESQTPEIVEEKETSKVPEIDKKVGAKKPLAQLEEENRRTLPKISTGKVFLNGHSRPPHEEIIKADKFEGSNTLPIETVKIDDIIPTQKNLTITNLEATQDVTDAEEDLYVIKHDSKYYIMDGHHRLANKILQGDSTVDVNVYDTSVHDTKPKELQDAKEIEAKTEEGKQGRVLKTTKPPTPQQKVSPVEEPTQDTQIPSGEKTGDTTHKSNLPTLDKIDGKLEIIMPTKVEETGEVVSVKYNAKAELSEAREDVKRWQKLLDCLKS